MGNCTSDWHRGLWPESQSFSLLLTVSCLTVLSELEWCLAWWKGKALVLPTRLCQCKSVQDLDQHFCSQCSGWWSAYVWLIAGLLMQGRSGKMGATFIVILKELLPPAPTEMYHLIVHSHNTSFSVFFFHSDLIFQFPQIKVFNNNVSMQMMLQPPCRWCVEHKQWMHTPYEVWTPAPLH